ncbi:MAG: hypothetical protein PGN13_02055 [Patulibacter minatonensis]
MPSTSRPRAAHLRAVAAAGLLSALVAAPSLRAEDAPTPPPTPVPTALPTPTSDPTPVPAPPPTPVPTAPPAPFSVELAALGDLQVGTVVRLKTLPAPFKVSAAARVRIDLTVKASVGRRYGLRPKAGARTVVVATKSGSVAKPVWAEFDLPLSAAFRKRLGAKPTNFTATMTATATNAKGQTAKDSATVPITKRAQRRR